MEYNPLPPMMPISACAKIASCEKKWMVNGDYTKAGTVVGRWSSVVSHGGCMHVLAALAALGVAFC